MATKKVTLNGDAQSYSESDKEFIFRFIAAATDGSVKNDEYIFKIKTLFKNTAPSFKEALKTQIVTVGQSFQWQLPKIIDAEGDQISSVSVKFSKSWLKFDDFNNTFSFDGAVANESSAGNHVVPITITDQFGASATIKQNIIVEYIPPKEEVVETSSASAKNETSSASANNQTSVEEVKAAQ